jgi:peptidoglycan/xylan/chitin deacetylase (PgdA/CDA1 family)
VSAGTAIRHHIARVASAGHARQDRALLLRARQHDILGHGYHWYGPDTVIGSRMTREDERAEIRAAVESFERTTGQRIRGWMVRSFPRTPGNCASAVRDFIDYALQCEGVSFMRRIDVARYWQTTYPPPTG